MDKKVTSLEELEGIAGESSLPDENVTSPKNNDI